MKLQETKARLLDTRNNSENEAKKFDAIASDFKNQRGLVEYNYKKKIDDLTNEKNRQNNTINDLNNHLEEMRKAHFQVIEAKNKIAQGVKTNMEELSKYFSEQLSDVQKRLQDQIKTITEKWEGENNRTEHLKTYEEYVNAYDLNLTKEFNK
jgi:polyhydroxyalkanoate synthesis regulator phasin